MKIPPMEMMVRLSEIIDSYGLDVWLWLPNMGKDYVTEKGIQAELAEREEVFRRIKRLDHVLVPGGDPAFWSPRFSLLGWTVLRSSCSAIIPAPKSGFHRRSSNPNQAWLDSFYRLVNQKPSWLGGVASAPWVKTPVPEMRAIVKESIKIRNYPDITHNLQCQFPVPDWGPGLRAHPASRMLQSAPSGDEGDPQPICEVHVRDHRLFGGNQ
ncbi:MAG: hypothetical protein WDM96_17170 [Lacunisphaera sp.]